MMRLCGWKNNASEAKKYTVTQIIAHEKEPDSRPCLPCNTRTHLTGASGFGKENYLNLFLIVFFLLFLFSCNNPSLNPNVSSSKSTIPSPEITLPSLSPIDTKTGKIADFSEETQIPVLLDFGILNDLQKPCFCVEGPCKDKSNIPEIIINEIWNNKNLVKNKTIKFKIKDATKKYQILLSAKLSSFLEMNLKVNNVKLEPFYHDRDHYIDQFKKFSNLSLNESNTLEIENRTYSELPQDLNVQLIVRTEENYFHYCKGIPSTLTSDLLYDWRTMQGIFSEFEYDRGNEGHYIAFRNGMPNGSDYNIIDGVLIWNIPESVIINRYKFTEYNKGKNLILKPDPNLLGRIAKYVNNYHKHLNKEIKAIYGNREIEAISFSSPGVMYAFAVDADFKDLGLKGFSNPGFLSGQGSFLYDIYSSPIPKYIPTAGE